MTILMNATQTPSGQHSRSLDIAIIARSWIANSSESLAGAGKKERWCSGQGLLILEKDDGITEKVGEACVSSKLVSDLLWKWKLIVLG